MARGLKQQQQQQGWKEETSINTYTHTCKHALSLSTSLHLQLPQKPFKWTCASPKRKCNQELEISVAQGYDRIQKNQLETKKRKHDPREEKNFFYLHKK
jgi:hypothetical protein